MCGCDNRAFGFPASCRAKMVNDRFPANFVSTRAIVSIQPGISE
jgi:hypothetical protein